MSLIADEGLALFAGLNCFPKKSYLTEYSHRISHTHTISLLTAYNRRVHNSGLFSDNSFNLDFHSVPYFGEHPSVEEHYVSMRSRRQPAVLTFLAQDADGKAFCYSNADLRKGEESDEVINFIRFWKKVHGKLPKYLVFDSQLTTYCNLTRIDGMGITFITLRKRFPALLKDISSLPASAWRTINLDLPARKFKTPKVFEEPVVLEGTKFRQLFVTGLGHDQPTVLLTNDWRSKPAGLIARYAQRMLIENTLPDAVRFFHMNALSSEVGLKVDFDMALLVIASGMYRLLAQRMRGYNEAQARVIFRDLIDMPATICVTRDELQVRFHPRAHLPIILASELLNRPVSVPWWNNLNLLLTA